MINLFSKTDDFITIINLLNKTNDFITNDKFTCFKTDLGRSGHVRFQTFGPIWHVSGPKIVF